MPRVLGLDISLACTGLAVVDVDDTCYTLVDYTHIPTKAAHMSVEERLAVVYRTVKDYADRYHPEVWVAESQFFGANVKTLMQLSHTHGALLLLASTYGQRVLYYSPMTIKSVLLGGAHAKNAAGVKKTTTEWKQEVAAAVIAHVGAAAFTKPYTDDVTDSVAVALCAALKGFEGYLADKPKKAAKKPKPPKPEKG